LSPVSRAGLKIDTGDRRSRNMATKKKAAKKAAKKTAKKKAAKK